jgi:hypothetical protein
VQPLARAAAKRAFQRWTDASSGSPQVVFFCSIASLWCLEVPRVFLRRRASRSAKSAATSDDDASVNSVSRKYIFRRRKNGAR